MVGSLLPLLMLLLVVFAGKRKLIEDHIVVRILFHCSGEKLLTLSSLKLVLEKA